MAKPRKTQQSLIGNLGAASKEPNVMCPVIEWCVDHGIPYTAFYAAMKVVPSAGQRRQPQVASEWWGGNYFVANTEGFQSVVLRNRLLRFIRPEHILVVFLSRAVLWGDEVIRFPQGMITYAVDTMLKLGCRLLFRENATQESKRGLCL